MVGLDIPVIPVEHQYIVTEPDPALVKWRAEGNPEHPVLRDSDALWYVREERGGFTLPFVCKILTIQDRRGPWQAHLRR